MNEKLLRKQEILNSIISNCEIISTNHHTRLTIAQMRIDMYRGRIAQSTNRDIDELVYEIIEWVNTFLENNI